MKKMQDHVGNGTTFSDTITRTIKGREVTVSYSITVTDEMIRRIQHLLLESVTAETIEHKQQNPESGVVVDGQVITYNGSKEHKNIVISSTLNAIEDVILFRISSYFLKFSLEYKKYHKITIIQNDWYEYVEYGTTNPFTILLQRNGFSREASTYIRKNRGEFIVMKDREYRIKKTLLSCPNKGVCREAAEIQYNVPELFVD